MSPRRTALLLAAPLFLAGCHESERNNAILVRNRTDVALQVRYDHVHVVREDTDGDCWDDTVYDTTRLETRIPARSELTLSVADDDGASAVDARYLDAWRTYRTDVDDGFGIIDVRIEDYVQVPTGNG